MGGVGDVSEFGSAVFGVGYHESMGAKSSFVTVLSRFGAVGFYLVKNVFVMQEDEADPFGGW